MVGDEPRTKTNDKKIVVVSKMEITIQQKKYMTQEENLLELLARYNELGIGNELDNEKFYLYSIVTHSTYIEGSTMTEFETERLFEDGITTGGKTLHEHLMNIDLKNAYEQSIKYARSHEDITEKMLVHLESLVLKNTGGVFKGALGEINLAEGKIRNYNVRAGDNGATYMDFHKVPLRLKDFFAWVNEERRNIKKGDIIGIYNLSFDTHYNLVTIHPWGDGNGRMSRLLMNQIQYENGVIPTIVRKESKADYIAALMATREQEDLSIFRKFMFEEQCRNIEMAIKQHEESIQTDIVLKPSGSILLNTNGKDSVISQKETTTSNKRSVSQKSKQQRRGPKM